MRIIGGPTELQKLTDSVSNAIAELIAEKKIKYTEDKLNSKKQKLIIL